MIARRGFLQGLAAGLALGAAGPAAAVLGGDVASVQAGTLGLRGERRLSAGPGYTLHETRAADGALLREYADARGRVFLITWSMPGKPRMADLLGPLHADYRAAASRALARPGVQRQARLAQGDLVVQAGAHLNHHVGRAWLASAVPPGVDPGVLP